MSPAAETAWGFPGLSPLQHGPLEAHGHPGLTESLQMPLAGEEEGYMVLRCSRKVGGVLLRGGEWQEAQPSWLVEKRLHPHPLSCPIQKAEPEDQKWGSVLAFT